MSRRPALPRTDTVPSGGDRFGVRYHAAVAVLACVVLGLAAPAAAQMDIRRASGVPLPAADLPVGTVSVRVVRDTVANNLRDVDVVFTVDGRRTTVKTDAAGRAQMEGLPAGARVQATATVEGQRLETQPVVIESSGIRFMLVAGDGSTASPPAGAPAPGGVSASPAGPPVPGRVSFGPESRVVADFADERLNVYYVLQIVTGSSNPVDIGGPLTIELPQGARGASIIAEGTTANATANGPRVIVAGPFGPGPSNVSLAFELPFSGDTAQLEQQWPVDVERLTVFGLRSGNLDIASPQFASKQATNEQGQPLVIGFVNAIPANQPLRVAISGLPHRPVWPRNTALALGGAITLAGIWAAVFPPPRRRVA
jgi:hypothetical protein